MTSWKLTFAIYWKGLALSILIILCSLLWFSTLVVIFIALWFLSEQSTHLCIEFILIGIEGPVQTAPLKQGNVCGWCVCAVTWWGSVWLLNQYSVWLLNKCSVPWATYAGLKWPYLLTIIWNKNDSASTYEIQHPLKWVFSKSTGIPQ